jgi:hypothetical protein
MIIERSFPLLKLAAAAGAAAVGLWLVRRLKARTPTSAARPTPTGPTPRCGAIEVKRALGPNGPDLGSTGERPVIAEPLRQRCEVPWSTDAY